MFRTPRRTVSVFWTRRKNRLITTIRLEPAPGVGGLRGVLPFGLALSPDESRLYIACAGINAVAVFDTRRNAVLGYIPTGWFPARVALSKDGRTLYVANAKGYGAGPNGGADFQRGPEGDYIGDITKGTVSIIPVPPDSELAELTHKVIRNNGFAPAAPRENRGPRTFPFPPPADPVRAFATWCSSSKRIAPLTKSSATSERLAAQEVNGDPTLARWGLDAEVHEDGEPTLEHVRVTPNHHALAERFGLSDNYYVDSDVSFDGHHWLVDSYPNEWVETAWPPDYGGRSHLYYDNDAPGRMSLGGDSSLRPEDYLEAGSLWDHLARHHISFPELRRGALRGGRGGVRAHGAAAGSQPPHAGTALREHFANLSDVQHVDSGSVPVRAIQKGV